MNIRACKVTEGSTLHLVKPEHLSDIIATSRADFLVVLGDRNMRNRSCQAKEGGRLVEMSVDARVSSILAIWEKEREEERQHLEMLFSANPLTAIAASTTPTSGTPVDPVNPNVFTARKKDYLLSRYANVKSVGKSVEHLYSVLQAARGWNEGRPTKLFR